MSEHVTEADLLLAIDGELSPDHTEALRSHTIACRSCEARWNQMTQLSDELVDAQCPHVELRPEEFAVASLLSRIDHARAKQPGWTVRSLVWANSLAAVAVAVACIVAFPSLRVTEHAAPRPAPVYDFDQAVPSGYQSLPFADPALPLDDATVLPVVLSAEDLELMGIDAEDAPRDGVKAEILLGLDGWPRAIRIVEQN